MKTKFSKEDFSENLSTFWHYCFNSQCPLHDDCIHYVSSLFIDESLDCGHTIFPTAYRNGKCRHFKQARKIRGAWGFTKLFYDVKQRDATTIRTLMKKYLGGHTAYYRYANGTYKLTPEQQEAIISIFKRHGYTDGLEFDFYNDMPDLS